MDLDIYGLLDTTPLTTLMTPIQLYTPSVVPLLNLTHQLELTPSRQPSSPSENVDEEIVTILSGASV